MAFRHKIIQENSVSYLIIAVPHNLHWASLSHSGKSLVYRIKGMYIDSKGYFKGGEGKISCYINSSLAWICIPIKKGYYDNNDVEMFDFGEGELIRTIKIPLKQYEVSYS